MPLSVPQSILSQSTNTNPPLTSTVYPLSPLTELEYFMTAENASDIEYDRALFHTILQSGISPRSDADMMRLLEVRPGEELEALMALQMAEALSMAGEQGGTAIGGLEREFMESGIEVLTKLSNDPAQSPGFHATVPVNRVPGSSTSA